MGRLQKVSAKDVPQASSVESPDSSKDPFVPNDFADENVMSLVVIFVFFSFSLCFFFVFHFHKCCAYCLNFSFQDFSGDDEEFDKALYNFYLNNVSFF